MQAAFLDDPLLYKKREFIDTLLGLLDVGKGGKGFSLKDKVDAIDFRHEKVLETKKPDITPDPIVAPPDPEKTGAEDEEEKLPKIIERLNSLFGVNLKSEVVSKNIGQMETALKGDEALSKTAKVTSFEDYKLALYSVGQDVMSDCLDQSESFYHALNLIDGETQSQF